jgi:hypothetical protein
VNLENLAFDDYRAKFLKSFIAHARKLAINVDGDTKNKGSMALMKFMNWINGLLRSGRDSEIGKKV